MSSSDESNPPTQDDKTKRPRAKYGVSDPFAEQSVPKPPRAPQMPAAVAPPEVPATIYKAFPSALTDQLKEAAPTPKPLAGGEAEKRAVWIVHGMGQQIKFATLDSLTEGIMSVAKPPVGQNQFTPKASSARIGDQILQRVELSVASADGSRNIDLHLYEAYWAPLTEGVANLTDVVGFLVNGSTRGLLNSFKWFKRAMFGQICEFKIKFRVPLYILSILILLGSLIVVNAVIVGETASHVNIFGSELKVLAESWAALTSLASALSAFGIVMGTMLFLAEMWKPLPPSGTADEVGAPSSAELRRRATLSSVTWTGTIIAALGVVLTAILFLIAVTMTRLPAFLAALVAGEFNRLAYSASQLQFASTLAIFAAIAIIALAMTVRAAMRSQLDATASNPILQALLYFTLAIQVALSIVWVISIFREPVAWLDALGLNQHVRNILSSPWWVWPFLIFLSSQVRSIMVEYVGDVAIYITPNKLDRFDQVREKIKDTAYKSASAVFLAQSPTGNHFEYERIAIIGHSLGSVIAYDTLCALINDDRLAGGKLRISERTCLLETFGSPLNKIAFFFTIQGTDSFQMREQLAEAVQPLIMDYRYRPYPWVNVHSPSDIISGDVYFYDWPPANSTLAKAPPEAPAPVGFPQHQAIDIEDPNACVALAAHVDYWKNRLIWEKLYEQIAK